MAERLTADEAKIAEELLSVQGTGADIGGNYFPNPDKAQAVMRPSKTLNAVIDAM